MDPRSIEELLARVGPLNDDPGPETGRERFRRFLISQIEQPESLRRYIEECLTDSDAQRQRALQDLVTRLGGWLGFRPSFAPYEWLPGEPGYAGRWAASSGETIVLKVKTEETHAGQRPGLARAIERMLIRGELARRESSLGLYVVPDPGLPLTHIERAIIDDRQARILRIITLDSLFTLVELARRGLLSPRLTHSLLRASATIADPAVELMAGVVASPGENSTERAAKAAATGRGEQLAVIARELGDLLDCLAAELERLLLGGRTPVDDL